MHEIPNGQALGLQLFLHAADEDRLFHGSLLLGIDDANDLPVRRTGIEHHAMDRTFPCPDRVLPIDVRLDCGERRAMDGTICSCQWRALCLKEFAGALFHSP